MSTPKIRMVNTLPNVKIKKEIEDDEEDSVACRQCKKGFLNDVALRNHVRMEHFDMYASGDPAQWTTVPVPKLEDRNGSKRSLEELVKKRHQDVLAQMGSTSLLSLASKDVSYIIIKSDDPVEVKEAKKRKLMEKVDKEKKQKVMLVMEKKKEAQPITGPFECLQPSTLVADGTCHQIFFSCCEYSVHFRDEHTRRRKALRCQVCEKPIPGQGAPTAPATPYPCEVCGAGFDTNRQLADHIAAMHVKLKPYQCQICQKRFTQLGGLQQHTRMHTGDRPYACSVCPKAFTQKSGLDQHLRIHTKVRPYRCVICSKTFAQSVHLKQHMRTHTNVAPFQCGLCHKTFKQSSHLNYHLKNHDPAALSAAQRDHYCRLVGLIAKEEVGEEVVTVEVDNENETEEYDTEVVEGMDEEQARAEESILPDQEYVASEGGRVWTVTLTNS